MNVLTIPFALLLSATVFAACPEDHRWEFESDLHQDYRQEDIRVSIDGKPVFRLQTRQSGDHGNAWASWCPTPGAHRYSMRGSSWRAEKGSKVLKVEGGGWLYAQEALRLDFDRAAGDVYQRFEKIRQLWLPRIEAMGGEIAGLTLHPAASSQELARAEARLGVKLPEFYKRWVSKPYLVAQTGSNQQKASDGIVPPAEIETILSYISRRYGDPLKEASPAAKRNFQRMARHFILGCSQGELLFARDDNPRADSRAAQLMPDKVYIAEEITTEDSDPYEWYPFAPRKVNSNQAAEELTAKYIDDIVFLILARRMQAGGIALPDRTAHIRLWREYEEDGVLGMSLKPIGSGSIEDEDEDE